MSRTWCFHVIDYMHERMCSSIMVDLCNQNYQPLDYTRVAYNYSLRKVEQSWFDVWTSRVNWSWDKYCGRDKERQRGAGIDWVVYFRVFCLVACFIDLF